MVNRARDRRRRGTQYTGVLRGNSDRASTESVPHSTPRQSRFQWRLVSGMITLCLVIILAMFFTSDVFYVRSVAVGGVNYLTKEEVFAFADVANMHIFWVSADQVRANILRSPSVADARVDLSWPPNMINIIIEEREPALVWMQSGTAMWVDIQGRVMAQREDRPDLTTLIAEPGAEQGPLTGDGRVDTDIVHGTLQLQELMPQVTTLRYDPVNGLGYKNDNGWDVWFGVGTDMPQKVLIYRNLASNILARGIQPGVVNVADPEAPFYTVLWGR